RRVAGQHERRCLLGAVSPGARRHRDHRPGGRRVSGALLLSPALDTDPTHLDPLGWDGWYAQRPPLVNRYPHELIDMLPAAVPRMAAPPDVPSAMAILRDVDPPLCILERWLSGQWRAIYGLEDALIHLGRVR